MTGVWVVKPYPDFHLAIEECVNTTQVTIRHQPGGIVALFNDITGFFWKHPALTPYDWIWRLDSDIHFHCDLVSNRLPTCNQYE